MKKIKHLLFGFLIIAATNSSYSQTYGYDTTQYYGKMNWIYYNVNTSLVTTGLLRDYRIAFLDST